MPTTVRESVRRSPPPPWGEVARLFLLLAQVRLIDAQLNFLYRGGRSPQGEKLLRLMRRWLVLHEAFAVIVRRPPPPHVEQVRAILRVASQRPRPPTQSVETRRRAWGSRLGRNLTP